MRVHEVGGSTCTAVLGDQIRTSSAVAIPPMPMISFTPPARRRPCGRQSGGSPAAQAAEHIEPAAGFVDGVSPSWADGVASLWQRGRAASAALGVSLNKGGADLRPLTTSACR
jgi:hypothetical protein